MLKYSIKITLKNEDAFKDAYREAVVPANITFSQFATLINCLLNYKESPSFYFSINDEIVIDENGDPEWAKECDLRHADAKESFISDYCSKDDEIIYLVEAYEHVIELRDIEECETDEIVNAELTASFGIFPQIPEDVDAMLSCILMENYYNTHPELAEEEAEFIASLTDDTSIEEIQEIQENLKNLSEKFRN